MRQNSLCVYLFKYSREKELYNFMRLSIQVFSRERVIQLHETIYSSILERKSYITS